jgi:hypothetical protein
VAMYAKPTLQAGDTLYSAPAHASLEAVQYVLDSNMFFVLDCALLGALRMGCRTMGAIRLCKSSTVDAGMLVNAQHRV